MKGQRRRIALMLAICIMLPCAACGGQKAPDPTPVPAEAPALTETPTPYPELTEAPKPSPAPTETPAPVSYADTLFDTGCVHRVDVIISDEDWAELLAAPIDKTKYTHLSASTARALKTSPSPRRGIPASIMSRMIRAASATASG